MSPEVEAFVPPPSLVPAVAAFLAVGVSAVDVVVFDAAVAALEIFLAPSLEVAPLFLDSSWVEESPVGPGY